MKEGIIIDPLLDYHEIARLNSLEMARFINAVETSGIVEIADESVTRRLNHIVLHGEQKPIAYFGADNQVELVNPQDSSLKISHAYLEGLYERCLDKNQRRIL